MKFFVEKVIGEEEIKTLAKYPQFSFHTRHNFSPPRTGDSKRRTNPTINGNMNVMTKE